MVVFSVTRGAAVTEDEREVKELIERWVRAVNAGDLEGVVEQHTEDVVMFDVPPPYEGVRGAAAYRAVWPPFLEWQRSAAVFELDSMEITTSSDVAFAHALVRCGPEADVRADPVPRLRLTLGLRKEGGRWVISHEHHSFPLVEDAPARREDGDAGR
jgi:uncharacterized protein (TIGR02246 family)